jgi:hypothetical protein
MEKVCVSEALKPQPIVHFKNNIDGNVWVYFDK